MKLKSSKDPMAMCFWKPSHVVRQTLVGSASSSSAPTIIWRRHRAESRPKVTPPCSPHSPLLKTPLICRPSERICCSLRSAPLPSGVVITPLTPFAADSYSSQAGPQIFRCTRPPWRRRRRRRFFEITKLRRADGRGRPLLAVSRHQSW